MYSKYERSCRWGLVDRLQLPTFFFSFSHSHDSQSGENHSNFMSSGRLFNEIFIKSEEGKFTFIFHSHHVDTSHDFFAGGRLYNVRSWQRDKWKLLWDFTEISHHARSSIVDGDKLLSSWKWKCSDEKLQRRNLIDSNFICQGSVSTVGNVICLLVIKSHHDKIVIVASVTGTRRDGRETLIEFPIETPLQTLIRLSARA